MQEELSLSQIIFHLTRMTFLVAHKKMQHIRVHPGQMQLLCLLENQEAGLTQRALAEKHLVRPSTVAVTLRRMEQAGLILRERNPKDQRASLIRISDKGRAAAALGRASAREIEEEILKGFSQEEKRQLLEYLKRMKQNLSEATGQPMSRKNDF